MTVSDMPMNPHTVCTVPPPPPPPPSVSGLTSPVTQTSTDVLDMPVDPNEPTYCLCHQVSFGEMIGCDNADVSMIFSIQYPEHKDSFRRWTIFILIMHDQRECCFVIQSLVGI